ncbi:MAG: hypothetical protein LBC82_05865 [Oscillospiraceae bacterium]|nr:hypothetical protein [Oscillospiraceae bacterium]
MLLKEDELIEILSNVFNISYELISKEPFEGNGLNSWSGGGVSLFNVNSRYVICKIRTSSMHENIGLQIDPDGKEEFLDLWLTSPHSIKMSLMKEINIYKELEENLKKHIPNFYGSYSHSNCCVLFMGYIENNLKHNPMSYESEMSFLASLHNAYFEKESLCQTMGVFIPTIDYYKQSKSIYAKLIHCVEKNFPCYNEFLRDTKDFANSIDDNYIEIINYGRTLCHGDYAHVNMIKTKECLKVYDWEHSSFYNPEFDLIQFLTRHSTDINHDYIVEVLKTYYHKISFRKSKSDFHNCLLLNSHLLFLTTMSWVMLMLKENFPTVEINNFLFLYNFLKRHKLAGLI